MPKKAHLESHLSREGLKRCYLHSCEAVESRRWHLLWMIASGWTIKKAAEAIAINYDYAKEILYNYNRQGVVAIPNRRKMVCRNRKNALLNAQGLSKLGHPILDFGFWILD